ncbi:flagellin [Halegenticoccus soli]|uniref:flagellin n=1 Tax=Halegenticoccus soli TaxID=1985678 RepID=UPI000C6CAC74|nr:flagellin [Halegenticoccus soli]
MGFSVSGSAAIVFAGMFIAFGILYPTVSNGFERVNDARSDAAESDLDRRNTDFEIATAEYNATDGALAITAENTGSTALSVSRTDVLVDGEYQTLYDAAVEGDGETDLWLPGESLNVSVPLGSEPDRVAVVTSHGVSRSEVV